MILRQPRLRRWLLGLLIVVQLNMHVVHARPLTTGEIVSHTVNLATLRNCMQWTIIGLCIWLRCGLFGCRIRTSILVGNYNPDLVVSGYHTLGQNPWQEMAALYGPAQIAAAQSIVTGLGAATFVGQGDRANEKFSRSHEALSYKEADAIGHPIASLLAFLPAGFLPFGNVPDGFSLQSALIVCPSETQSFTPYLLSGMDALAWRFAIPEMIFPQSLIPGLREIGHWPLNTWQAVYPRSGFTLQDEQPKAAAVVAQRAGDIVTRSRQPHVYIPTMTTRLPSPGLKVFYPGPLIETQRKTGYWQMLSPHPASSCEVFGQNDTLSPLSWADGKGDPQGDYAWNLWRPYKCCRVRGQILLSVIQFVPWPP